MLVCGSCHAAQQGDDAVLIHELQGTGFRAAPGDVIVLPLAACERLPQGGALVVAKGGGVAEYNAADGQFSQPVNSLAKIIGRKEYWLPTNGSCYAQFPDGSVALITRDQGNNNQALTGIVTLDPQTKQARHVQGLMRIQSIGVLDNDTLVCAVKDRRGSHRPSQIVVCARNGDFKEIWQSPLKEGSTRWIKGLPDGLIAMATKKNVVAVTDRNGGVKWQQDLKDCVMDGYDFTGFGKYARRFNECAVGNRKITLNNLGILTVHVNEAEHKEHHIH